METGDDGEREETNDWILCEGENSRVRERSGECVRIYGGRFGRRRTDRKGRVEIYKNRDRRYIEELELKNRSKSGRLGVMWSGQDGGRW